MHIISRSGDLNAVKNKAKIQGHIFMDNFACKSIPFVYAVHSCRLEKVKEEMGKYPRFPVSHHVFPSADQMSCLNIHTTMIAHRMLSKLWLFHVQFKIPKQMSYYWESKFPSNENKVPFRDLYVFLKKLGSLAMFFHHSYVNTIIKGIVCNLKLFCNLVYDTPIFRIVIQPLLFFQSLEIKSTFTVSGLPALLHYP